MCCKFLVRMLGAVLGTAGALGSTGCNREPSRPAPPAPPLPPLAAPGGTIRETATTRNMDTPQRPPQEPRRIAGEGFEHALTREQALRDLYTDVNAASL